MYTSSNLVVHIRQPDLVPLLHNDRAPANYTDGGIQRSRAWAEKVTNNPNINSDPRHQAITISADGVPLFKDRNAGSAWPFIARTHTLEDGLSLNLAYTHMFGFEMCDHKTWDATTMEVTKLKQESKSFDPLLTRMTDDLLQGQKKGYLVNDHTRPEPDRAFYVKLVLLCVLGDYMGQAKLSNFRHMGTFKHYHGSYSVHVMSVGVNIISVCVASQFSYRIHRQCSTL